MRCICKLAPIIRFQCNHHWEVKLLRELLSAHPVSLWWSDLEPMGISHHCYNESDYCCNWSDGEYDVFDEKKCAGFKGLVKL